LEEMERGDLDAGRVFDSLDAKVAQMVRTRIDHWLQRNVFRKYFHGFSGKYSGCFVFKWEERHKPQRLYGFLCHPFPKTNTGFELCVLVYHDTKDDTMDYAILGRINRLCEDIRVLEAIAREYPEIRGTPQWTN